MQWVDEAYHLYDPDERMPYKKNRLLIRNFYTTFVDKARRQMGRSLGVLPVKKMPVPDVNNAWVRQ